MAREMPRRSVPVGATAPWRDDFQRIIQQFMGDADASLTGVFSPALDVEENDEGFRRIERRFGRFHRAVRLPDRMDPDGINATYKDGLLTITVPKAESAKPRRIQVSSD